MERGGFKTGTCCLEIGSDSWPGRLALSLSVRQMQGEGLNVFCVMYVSILRLQALQGWDAETHLAPV